MHEQIEVLDESGEPTGVMPRNAVHQLGLWHRAAFVFLFTPEGKLVVQRRQANKDVWPNAWDLSVAEHLTPGEDYLAAAVRGLNEELGVKGLRLETASNVFRSKLDIIELGIKDYEFQLCFKGIWDGELFPNPDEVAEIRLFPLGELHDVMKLHPTEFTPWSREQANRLQLFS